MLGKGKLDTIELIISKPLIVSSINCEKFVSVNNVLRVYNQMKEEIKVSRNFCLWNTLYKYGWYNHKNIRKNGIETIVDNDEIFWLNEKHIEQGRGYKNLQEISIKYQTDHRKHRYELADEPKRQSNRVFIHDKLAIKVLMDCGTTAPHKFRTRSKFKQCDAI